MYHERNKDPDPEAELENEGIFGGGYCFPAYTNLASYTECEGYEPKGEEL